MGSGLILLVIVGAWLAVLVPMALRAQDSGAALSSVDRFSDAMRVLARRPVAARDSAEDGEEAEEASPDDAPAARRRVRLPSVAGGLRRPWRRRPKPARAERSPAAVAAARRRRVLLVLLALAAGTLAAGLLGRQVPLLAVHGAVDLVLVLFLVGLRRQARRRAVQRAERRAAQRRAARRRAGIASGTPSAGRPAVRVPAQGRPGHPTGPGRGRPAPVPATRSAEDPRDVPADRGEEHAAPAIPEQLPAAVEPAAVPAQAAIEEAAPVDLPAPVLAPVPEQPTVTSGSLGRPWQPVPVPLPTYVTAPVARRPVIDLNRPNGSGRDTGRAQGRTERVVVVERRRAVNDW